MKLEMMVNDRPVSIDVAPNVFLADVLRYPLGLTGTKIGCQEAECGTCTVLVNGTPVNSCIYPAVKAAGCSVETIEGLGRGDQLHPLQQAFIDHGAVQCGFCTPGLIMTSKALLDRNPAPTDDDIKQALKDTYCRCTGYVTHLSAILRPSLRIIAVAGILSVIPVDGEDKWISPGPLRNALITCPCLSIGSSGCK